jgi:SnoaL-like domain
MTTHKQPLEIAITFTGAWTGHDMEEAAKYVAKDVVFDGPMQQSSGSEAYLKGLTKLSEGVDKYKLIAAFGDEKAALLMYDLTMTTGVVLTCAKHLVIRAGKIHRDTLTFDSKKLKS